MVVREAGGEAPPVISATTVTTRQDAICIVVSHYLNDNDHGVGQEVSNRQAIWPTRYHTHLSSQVDLLNVTSARFQQMFAKHLKCERQEGGEKTVKFTN